MAQQVLTKLLEDSLAAAAAFLVMVVDPLAVL